MKFRCIKKYKIIDYNIFQFFGTKVLILLFFKVHNKRLTQKNEFLRKRSHLIEIIILYLYDFENNRS